MGFGAVDRFQSLEDRNFNGIDLSLTISELDNIHNFALLRFTKSHRNGRSTITNMFFDGGWDVVMPQCDIVEDIGESIAADGLNRTNVGVSYAIVFAAFSTHDREMPGGDGRNTQRQSFALLQGHCSDGIIMLFYAGIDALCAVCISVPFDKSTDVTLTQKRHTTDDEFWFLSGIPNQDYLVGRIFGGMSYYFHI